MNIRRLAIGAIAGSLFVAVGMGQTGAGAAPGLTNDSILKLAKAGLSTEVIVAMVNNQPGNYTLDADSVIALKAAGVSETIITAMVTHTGSSQKAQLPVLQRATGGDAAAARAPVRVSIDGPDENGVYRPGTRVGGASVQQPRMIFSGTSSQVSWTGKNVCGGNLRATYVVAVDGRATDIAVVEGVHYVYEKGLINAVDGADPGQVKNIVEHLKSERFQPGTLDGTPVPVRMEYGSSQACHN